MLVRREPTVTVGIETVREFLAMTFSISSVASCILLGGGAFRIIEVTITIRVPSLQMVTASASTPIMGESAGQLLPLLWREHDEELIEVPHRCVAQRVGVLLPLGHQLSNGLHVTLWCIEFLSDPHVQIPLLGSESGRLIAKRRPQPLEDAVLLGVKIHLICDELCDRLRRGGIGHDR